MTRVRRMNIAARLVPPLLLLALPLAIVALVGLTAHLSGSRAGAAPAGPARAETPAGTAPSVVVLGIDGMDPGLLTQYMEMGIMPNFERLMKTGSYSELQTSIPPQSPVAWSNFITGMDPGGHGIFDFIHQDRSNYMPVFSTAVVQAPERTLRLGKWVIPLSKGRVELLRRGQAFWQLLDEGRVPYLVFRIPANFPPVESKGVSVAGMGTPDLLGTYGTFSFYTDDPTLMSADVSGGEIYPVEPHAHTVTAAFHGPENSMLAAKPALERPFTVHLDPENETALFTVGHRKLILQEGEWSDWVEVDFDVMGPFSRISGITRLYLKSVAPYFQLYATPININPADPALPISSSTGFSRSLYEKIGYHYTQGMPEDTKALEWDIFTDAEFIEQSNLVFEERLRMLDAILDGYDGGFLFFYFSSIDQVCHMLWKNMDPKHPGHTAERARHKDHIQHLYARMDSVLGVVEKRIPDDATLIVMSDHGFAPYYKKFNLNTWLYENGFLTLQRPKEIGRHALFANLFWRRTRAFALGINGLYVNLRGREAKGIVRGEDYDALLGDITDKLLAYRDPESGAQVVRRVYRASEVYHGDAADDGPDLIIGYDRGYRGSDGAAIGNLSEAVLTPNMDKWSGDHCMAYEVVPGVLLCNRPLEVTDPSLTDLSATILDLYGIAPPEVMRGRVVFHR
ncbi:MAG: alkaline phosphatase family protein [Candidatus Krumholzibacteriia bacterium]